MGFFNLLLFSLLQFFYLQQPPAGAIPQQMPIGTEPGPGYNPMYQAPPTTSYAPPTDGSNMEQPQGGVPQSMNLNTV